RFARGGGRIVAAIIEHCRSHAPCERERADQRDHHTESCVHSSTIANMTARRKTWIAFGADRTIVLGQPLRAAAPLPRRIIERVVGHDLGASAGATCRLRAVRPT